MSVDNTSKSSTGARKEDAWDNVTEIEILFVHQAMQLSPTPSLSQRDVPIYETVIVGLQLTLQISVQV